MSTDIEPLRRRVSLPEQSTDCVFRVSPMGRPGGLGPTDTQLVAWVAVSSMEDLDTLYGAPRRTRGPVVLSESEAQLLPEAVRSGLSRSPKGAYQLSGPLRAPKQHTGGWRVTRVVEVGDTGVLIWAMSL